LLVLNTKIDLGSMTQMKPFWDNFSI